MAPGENEFDTPDLGPAQVALIAFLNIFEKMCWDSVLQSKLVPRPKGAEQRV